MKKKNTQLILCLLIIAVLGLQQAALVSAKAPPSDIRINIHMYGTVKKTGTSTVLSGATVTLYGNGVYYLGSTSTDSNGNFNFYKIVSTHYSYVKAQVSKSGYQTTTKNAYNVDDNFNFGTIYLAQLNAHYVSGYVKNDQTSNPVAGVEVMIYGSADGVEDPYTYVGSTTTDSNGYFSKTVYSAIRFHAMKVILSKDNYYERQQIVTGFDTYYYGFLDIHAYQKIGVFFYVNPGYQVTEEQIDGQIDAYQDILEDEGFTKFFEFQDTDDFVGDFAGVNNYEREHDVVFLYTFSHGDDSGWLKLGGQTYPAYKVQVLQVITCLESLDSNKVGWVVTACFAGNAYDEASSHSSEIFLITSSNDEVSQFYCPGSGYTEQPYRCAFAYPFFASIASGKNAIDAYWDAEDETAAGYYDHRQFPLIYNGLADYTFFD
ncbi:MAG: carboxypeptidase regulatory-like domain-containing protein [Candidatus Thorarchaeota archaeon]|nr:MAG: carboxypeptidase regulatory-like domain-containing protein [Candidatus Thorarchaeota archaeon]